MFAPFILSCIQSWQLVGIFGLEDKLSKFRSRSPSIIDHNDQGAHMQSWVESDPEIKAEKVTDTAQGQGCQTFSLCPSHSSDIYMARSKAFIFTEVGFTFLKSKQGNR